MGKKKYFTKLLLFVLKCFAVLGRLARKAIKQASKEARNPNALIGVVVVVAICTPFLVLGLFANGGLSLAYKHCLSQH